MVTGALVVERIHSYPGVGTLLFQCHPTARPAGDSSCGADLLAHGAGRHDQSGVCLWLA